MEDLMDSELTSGLMEVISMRGLSRMVLDTARASGLKNKLSISVTMLKALKKGMDSCTSPVEISTRETSPMTEGKAMGRCFG